MAEWDVKTINRYNNNYYMETYKIDILSNIYWKKILSKRENSKTIYVI